MSDNSWDRIQELFLKVVDLPLAEREVFLERECNGDRELEGEVASLVRADGTVDSPITSAIESEVGSLLADDAPLVGTNLGPYRLLHEIGRGGMGTVYLAERDDEHFRKVVAVKVVKRGMDSAEVLRRFRHERQILAALEHPYIARLIDGGATPDGRPFFVMEQVEGQPIEVYCRKQGLDLESRLRLFLRVCEAVAYAHRALVVHRDLKPVNILVTSEGIPKLLDFGVAKLLDASADPGLTTTAMGPLTPEYASPEQIRGLPVTTAADVYALGAILFELLTGTRAQKIETHSPSGIEHAVCETETPQPSTVAKSAGAPYRLHSDLDNIVLMAMRKEPERRYQSVNQLAEDITRYLNGRPIIARQDSFRYRAGKFVRRNRLAVAATILIFLSLLAGIAATSAQARKAEAARRTEEAQRTIAEHERFMAEEQRKEAERERAIAESQTQAAKTQQELAERRLTEMIELSNRSLYDVHSAIGRLPGATEARRKIVATTLQFLQSLSKDAAHDERLRLVLSAAYMKVADVQGDPMRPSLGDSQGALADYRKAEQLLKPLLAKEPDRVEYLIQWTDIQIDLTELLSSLGNYQEAARIGGAALPGARKLARLCPAKAECLSAEPDLCSALVLALRDRDPSAALVYSNEHIESRERVLHAFPGNTIIAMDLATAYSQAATIRNRRGELREAVDLYRRAISIREDAMRRSPPNAEALRTMMITYGNLAGNLGSPFFLNLGDPAGAREYYGKALAIARDLAKADADNQVAQYDLANALLFYASVDLSREEWPALLAMLRESDGILQKLVAADPGSVSKRRALARAQEYEGRRTEALGNRPEAIALYRQSLAESEKVLAKSPSDPPAIAQALEDEEAIAAALALQGDRASALEGAQRAVARAERLKSSAGYSQEVAISRLAEAYRQLGSVHATFGEWKEARTSAERATGLWRQLAQTGSKMVVQAEADRAEALLKEASAHPQ